MSYSGFSFKSGFVLIIAACALASACDVERPASISTVEVVKRPLDSPNTEYTGRRVLAKPGDNLYSISFEAGMNYVDVAKWNGVEGPNYTIHPNQEIILFNPDADSIVEAPAEKKPLSNMPVADETVKTASQPAQPQPVTSTSSDVVNTAEVSSSGWIWPTEGTVVRNFSQANNINGIQIAGELGTPVRASSSGEVVYSGTGLPGYGRLIIVKHDSRFLSAYAHNSRVVVNEGDRVQQGQKIAEMGDTDTDRVKLHFEIRLNGNPVNPREYLPKG